LEYLARHGPQQVLAPANLYRNHPTQTGAVTFGAPDILDQVARSANAAMKAAWYHKWLVHRRLRPEEAGGRIHHHLTGIKAYPLHPKLTDSPVLERLYAKQGSYLCSSASWPTPATAQAPQRGVCARCKNRSRPSSGRCIAPNIRLLIGRSSRTCLFWRLPCSGWVQAERRGVACRPHPETWPEEQSVASESKKTVLAALFANLAIAVAKTVAGLLGGSAAMLAEAAHSFADTMNQVFLLVSLSLGDREPDEDHPFGYGKERFFWALLAAVFIFVSGSLFSLWQGVHGLLSGETVEGGYLLTYAVLVFALVAEGISWWRAAHQVRSEAATAGKPVRVYVQQSNDPTVKTVLFEDSAAVAGVLLALAGVGLHQLTGMAFFDAGASILIGVLLAYIAYRLGRDTKGLLIGEAARPEQREALRRTILAHPEVEAVLELLTMHLGPASLLVAVRLDLRDGLSSQQVEAVSTRIEAELAEVVPEVTQVFLDPTPRELHRQKAEAPTS
jgi:cation diffusion facilitator family transporter